MEQHKKFFLGGGNEFCGNMIRKEDKKIRTNFSLIVRFGRFCSKSFNYLPGGIWY